MKINKNKLEKAIENLEECEKLITERILENNTVGQNIMSKQATHAYVLYRKLIWNAKYIISEILNDK
jgi:hypothetical protein